MATAATMRPAGPTGRPRAAPPPGVSVPSPRRAASPSSCRCSVRGSWSTSRTRSDYPGTGPPRCCGRYCWSRCAYRPASWPGCGSRGVCGVCRPGCRGAGRSGPRGWERRRPWDSCCWSRGAGRRWRGCRGRRWSTRTPPGPACRPSWRPTRFCSPPCVRLPAARDGPVFRWPPSSSARRCGPTPRRTRRRSASRSPSSI